MAIPAVTGRQYLTGHHLSSLAPGAPPLLSVHRVSLCECMGKWRHRVCLGDPVLSATGWWESRAFSSWISWSPNLPWVPAPLPWHTPILIYHGLSDYSTRVPEDSSEVPLSSWLPIHLSESHLHSDPKPTAFAYPRSTDLEKGGPLPTSGIPQCWACCRNVLGHPSVLSVPSWPHPECQSHLQIDFP